MPSNLESDPDNFGRNLAGQSGQKLWSTRPKEKNPVAHCHASSCPTRGRTRFSLQLPVHATLKGSGLHDLCQICPGDTSIKKIQNTLSDRRKQQLSSSIVYNRYVLIGEKVHK